MEITQRPVNIHLQYHAHLYFDADTLDFATQLSQEIAERFGLPVGRVHQRRVGPHPMWSCQILFTQQDFDTLIPWLDQERNGLTILVHGVTGDDLTDHTKYAYWLGEAVELDLRAFKS